MFTSQVITDETGPQLGQNSPIIPVEGLGSHDDLSFLDVPELYSLILYRETNPRNLEVLLVSIGDNICAPWLKLTNLYLKNCT